MRFFISTLIFGIGGFLLTGISALAAEPGTYRPGQPYMASSAANFSQCQLQCQGDAQCKGWNFVQPRRNQPGGICEYLAAPSAPVTSAISISGTGSVSAHAGRLIPAGTRTLRVGTPVRVGANPQNTTTRVGLQNITPIPSARATAAPTPRPIQSAARRPAPQTSTQPSRLQPQSQMQSHAQPRPYRHSLDAQIAVPSRHPAPSPGTASQTAAIAPSARLSPAERRLQAMVGDPATSALASSTPSTSGPPLPPGFVPPQTESSSQANHSAQMPLAPPKIPAGISTAAAQDSLFGSLYDDVTTPKSLVAEDIPNDPDAPIATVRSVPTGAVTVENMMAGGPGN